MAITDKNSLKTTLRRLVCEVPAADPYTRLSASPMNAPGEYGLASMLCQRNLYVAAQRRGLRPKSDTAQYARLILSEQSPLSDDAVDIRRAIDALGLVPEQLESGMGRYNDPAQYTRAVFDAAGLRTYGSRLNPLSPGPGKKLPQAAAYLDVVDLQQSLQSGNLEALDIKAAEAQVGAHYFKLAAWLFQLSRDEKARMMRVSLSIAQDFAGQAFLRHVVVPTCEKAGIALLLVLRQSDCEEELACLKALLKYAPKLRVVCVALDLLSGRQVIEAARQVPCIFPVLPLEGDLLEQGIRRLGANFSICGGGVSVIELLIGRWSRIRGAVAKVLCARYLALLGSGFSITEENMRDDIQRLLGGAWEAFLSVAPQAGAKATESIR